MTQLDLSQLDPSNLTRIVIDLNAQRLAQIDPALPELMRACAIPVSFNAEIVSQLVSVSASQPDSASASQPSSNQLDAATALSHLLTLPFIIQRQDGDYTYHDNSRNLILADWQTESNRYQEYVSRLVAYYEEQGKKVYKDEEYETALAWFNRAIELQPTGSVYNWRGSTRVSLGNYTAAVTDLTQAIEHGVVDDDTYAYLSLAHYYLNNTQAALSAAIHFTPKDAITYSFRGILYKNSGQTDQALADWSEAIRLDPQYTNAYNNRGLLYRKLDQPELALADYNQAIQLNPQDTSAYVNRSYLYIQSGQYKEGFADCEQAIQINPQETGAYYNRGCVWSLQGQVESAMRDLRQAFELDKAQGSTYWTTLAQTDSDLDSLRELPAFQALLAEFGGATANEEKSE